MIKSIIVGMLIVLYSISPATAAYVNNTYFDKWPNNAMSSATLFPITVWWQPENQLARYKQAGINIHISPGITSNAQLATLKSLGMYAIADYSIAIRDAADKDVLVAYMHSDEPDLAKADNNCIPPSVPLANYAAWTAADPSKPIYLGLSHGAAWPATGARGACAGQDEDYPEYCKSGDLIGFDVYPVTDLNDYINGHLEMVPRGVDNLRGWTDDKKPIWATIECTHVQNPINMPTPEQTKTEIWMALIHEAKGISYFVHEWYPSFAEAGLFKYPAMEAAVTAINAEITSLAPVLYSETIQNPIVDDGSAIPTSWRNKMNYMVKSYGGSTYLFVVLEANRTATDAVFDFGGALPANCTATVLSEGRSINVVNGSFTDSFGNYGLHLYKINAPYTASAVSDPGLALRNKLNAGIRLSANPCAGALSVLCSPELNQAALQVGIYSTSGELVAQLKTGAYTWNGKDQDGIVAQNGSYFAKVSLEGQSIIKTFVVINP